jgi:hypothetical protein
MSKEIDTSSSIRVKRVGHVYLILQAIYVEHRENKL